MTTQANVADAAAAQKKGAKRVLIGKVASAKMAKTVVVEVVRSVKHPIYGKYVRRRKRYKAHDEQSQYQVGDVVEIRECRPISKDKCFTVARLVERPEGT